jgi:hypothetical protein
VFTGPFLVIATGLLLAAGVAAVGRPDPLLTARAGHHELSRPLRLRHTLPLLWPGSPPPAAALPAWPWCTRS